MCLLVMVHDSYQGCTTGCCSHCIKWVGVSLYSFRYPQLLHQYGRGIQLWRLSIELPNTSAFLHGGEASFQFSAPPDNTVNPKSMVGINSCDSVVVIGYQVDEFTHTWLAECIIAQSHIYPCFTGKMSILTLYPLEPGCEDYSFLDQTLKTLSIVLILSSCTPLQALKLDAFFDEADAVPSSVYSGILNLVTPISDTSRLQLTHNIKSHILWCQAWALFLPVPQTGKMSDSLPSQSFSSI